ncbi:MAG TPA: hypothetical protein PKC66_03810, partial [Leptospiraceae bacterium]|nr:hypothetical protein [Leptospiraceae bacterium]
MKIDFRNGRVYQFNTLLASVIILTMPLLNCQKSHVDENKSAAALAAIVSQRNRTNQISTPSSSTANSYTIG